MLVPGLNGKPRDVLVGDAQLQVRRWRLCVRPAIRWYRKIRVSRDGMRLFRDVDDGHQVMQRPHAQPLRPNCSCQLPGNGSALPSAWVISADLPPRTGVTIEKQESRRCRLPSLALVVL
jgi:hypothetical protein